MREETKSTTVLFVIRLDNLTMEKIKVPIAARFFTNMIGCIGVAIVRRESGYKAYISIIGGHNVKVDLECIYEWGNQIELSEAIKLIKGGPTIYEHEEWNTLTAFTKK